MDSYGTVEFNRCPAKLSYLPCDCIHSYDSFAYR